MILRRIVEFAEKHATGVPTGYQPRFVTKVIQLRADGTLRQVIALSGEKRGKREGRTRMEPQETPARTVKIAPRLVTDNVNYVLGRLKEEDSADKVNARHTAWIAKTKEAATATADSSLRSIVAWVDQDGPAALREDPTFADDDEITFEVDGIFPTASPAIRDYWASSGETTTQRICFVTGIRNAVVERMPAPIKGIPGGQMSGTALVTVNNPSGESYGLPAALNSPISANAAEKLCNGLNHLLNERRGDRFKYALRMPNSVYVAWCREETEFDLWAEVNEPDPDHVQQLIRGAFSGNKGPDIPDRDFFVLSLSANAARIVVRDYHETTLQNVKDNIGRWFQRQEIVGLDVGRAKPQGIFRLAASLYRDASKEMPAHVPTALVDSAIRNRPLPGYLLGLAVKRNLAMQGPFTVTKAKTKVLATSRLALIKAALTPNPEDTSLMGLNTEQTNPAYHCGRMLAVLESIQRMAALPSKLNATLVDRNYGAACASPASIFGNLLKDATSAHLPKLRKNRPGAYIALDQRLTEIATKVGNEFPRTLPLKDQGLFALGYYHQRAHDFAEARKNRELKELADQANLVDATINEEEIAE